MMKGWIILAILAGVLYYLVTQTDKLDEPIAQTEALVKKIERKLDAMTSTQIIRLDQKKARLKADIAERLSASELQELDNILTTPDTLMDFKDEYCRGNVISHPVFNKDNLLFICDNL